MTLRQKNKSIYWAWKSMKQRCQNPRCHAYKNYGARGITVCDEWQTFEPFLEWCLANGHQKGLQLDRIDNDGNYEPSNCRWTTVKENSNNTRFTTHVSLDGEERCSTYYEELFNLPRGVISYWIRKHGREYAEMRLRDVSINGYKLCDYGYSHRKRVRHKSGMEFESVRACAKYFGVLPKKILDAINHNVGPFKGEVEYIDCEKGGDK